MEKFISQSPPPIFLMPENQGLKVNAGLPSGLQLLRGVRRRDAAAAQFLTSSVSPKPILL